ncbi:MAG TPA: HAD-IB family hydrolase, partial [Nocardioides sp.]|nr:HAD-IB family hydrolase [Nocardioides sp.]
MEIPPDPSAAAFFDVDNTVMQGASIFHLAKGLHRRKFFTTREILGAAWKQAYFRLVGDLLHGPAKGEAVKALAAREGLDLRRCSAYSDSFNDLPML